MRWRCERLKPPRMPGKAVHVRMHGPQDAGGRTFASSLMTTSRLPHTTSHHSPAT